MAPIRLSRLEIWSDLQCNGGTRLAFYSPKPSSAIRSREINGPHTLKVALHRLADAWTHVAPDRVFRVFMTDGTYHEWRITKPVEAHQKDGGMLAEIEAEDPLYDLGHSLIVRTEANGDAYTDFDLYGLSAAEHLTVILAAAPAYFVAGTVDFASTIKVDLTYRGFTPLQALRQLAAALPGNGAELEVTRNGTTNYQVHLRTTIGSSAPRGYFRYSRNLDSVRRTRDVTGQPSRVFPLGQDVESRRFDMGDASWEVSGVAGNTLTLLGTPIAFDDQLNGLYLEKDTGSTPTLITDTLLGTQQVVVASAAGISTGNRVQVRRNAAGAELLYLDRPGALRSRVAVLERADFPPVDNLVPNPFLSEWSAGLPVGWAKIGTPTVTEVTDAVYRRLGKASAQVTALSDEHGIETGWITVSPIKERPFFGGQISLFVVTGVVRFEILAEDAGAANQYVIPDATVTGGRAYTSVLNEWIERLAVQDQATNFFELGIVRVKLRILADRLDGVSGDASWYLDAGQLAQTHLGDLPFFDGRASNALWKAANDELVRWEEPPTQITVDLVDLHRIDKDAFPHDELVLGGSVDVDDSKLGISYDARIVRLVEELVQEGATQVELADRPEEISSILTEDGHKERRPGSLVPRGPDGHVDGSPRLDEDYEELYLFPGKYPAAQSVRYVSSSTPIVEADVLASPSTSNADQILVHTFTADRTQRWVGVAYYPAADGKGKVGRVHILPPWTFFTRENRPLLSWQTFPGARPSLVRIGLTVLDDGDQVALYHRSWTDGGAPPAFTRNPVGVGFVSDPHEVTVEVTRPATDVAPDVLFEAYAVDDQANESFLLKLRIKKSMVLLDEPRIYPELDEDGDKLYLVWQRNNGAARVQWLVDAVDEPTEPEVQGSTNFDTTGKVLIYTFDPNGVQTQKVFLGFIPQSNPDGGAVRDVGSLVVIPYTYRRGNDRPRIVHNVLDQGDPGIERIMLTVLDDGDQVVLFYRTYVKGTGPPGYTREPGAGYRSDPLDQIVSFTKPAEGAANQVIEAYAEDDTAPTPLRSLPFYIEADGDAVPSGIFHTTENLETGIVTVIPLFMDSDAGSWRYRVKKVAITDATFAIPTFSDDAADEFKGNTFGTPTELTGFALPKGERLNIYGWFFRTTSSVAATQSGSTRSVPVTAVEKQGPETENWALITGYMWVPDPLGSGTWGLQLSILKGPLCESVSLRSRYHVEFEIAGDDEDYSHDLDLTDTETLVMAPDETLGFAGQLVVGYSPGYPPGGGSPFIQVFTDFVFDVTPYDDTGGAGGAGIAGVTYSKPISAPQDVAVPSHDWYTAQQFLEPVVMLGGGSDLAGFYVYVVGDVTLPSAVAGIRINRDANQGGSGATGIVYEQGGTALWDHGLDADSDDPFPDFFIHRVGVGDFLRICSTGQFMIGYGIGKPVSTDGIVNINNAPGHSLATMLQFNAVDADASVTRIVKAVNAGTTVFAVDPIGRLGVGADFHTSFSLFAVGSKHVHLGLTGSAPTSGDMQNQAVVFWESGGDFKITYKDGGGSVVNKTVT